MTAAMNWILRVLADAQGVPDDGRVAALAMVFTYIGLACWTVVVEGRPFDMQQFGIGAGALSVGIGGWFGFRRGN